MLRRVLRAALIIITFSAEAALAKPLPATITQSGITLTKFAEGIRRPVTLVESPDGTGRLFVVEQYGRIKIIENGEVHAKPFLDLTANIPTGEYIATQYETGLLGLVFHPDYATNGRFFVYYTDKSLTIHVSEFRADPSDPNRALRKERRLLSSPHPQYTNHFGGQLQFGPDGMLYIGLADGGGVGDPNNHAQNPRSLQGKILRLDVDAESGKYGIPTDNPFVGNSKFRPEIYALGFRNPWRFQFDSSDGRLFVSDVGQYSFEEVNLVVAGGNYGWNIREADSCFNRSNALRPLSPDSCASPQHYHGPIYYYSRPQPFTYSSTAIIGAGVYRGAAIPELEGEFVFADFTHGWIHSISEKHGGGWKSRVLFNGLPFLISSFGTGSDGELYVCVYGEKGAIYKMTPAADS